MAFDFSVLNDTVLVTFGRTDMLTFVPSVGSQYALAAVVDHGKANEETRPGTWISIWAPVSEFVQLPTKADFIDVAAQVTGVQAGRYKVVDIDRDAEQGIRLGLQWVRQ